MSHLKVNVVASWDEEAGVWYVVESNVPGLAIEAKSKSAFEKAICNAVPELMALNGIEGEHLANDGLAPAELVYQQHREVALSC